MVRKAFVDNIILPSKKDVLRVHLYLRLIQYGIQPFENDIDILLELYCFGGYKGKDKQEEFITRCIDKRFKSSRQSIRNILSKYTVMGVLDKPKNLSLFMNNKFIPAV